MFLKLQIKIFFPENLKKLFCSFYTRFILVYSNSLQGLLLILFSLSSYILFRFLQEVLGDLSLRLFLLLCHALIFLICKFRSLLLVLFLPVDILCKILWLHTYFHDLLKRSLSYQALLLFLPYLLSWIIHPKENNRY